MGISVPGEAPDCQLETLGVGSAVLGDPASGRMAASKLPGGSERRAEVTAAEFLLGRFPAPPQCPCQRGWARVRSCPREWRGLYSGYRPGTSCFLSSPSVAADLSWVSSPKWWLFSGWGLGEPPVLLDPAQEPATSDFPLSLQLFLKANERVSCFPGLCTGCCEWHVEVLQGSAGGGCFLACCWICTCGDLRLLEAGSDPLLRESES